MVPAVRAASGPLNWMNVSPGWAGWAQCLPIFLVPLEFLLSTLGHLPPATLIRPTHHRCTTSTNIFIKFSVFIFVFFGSKKWIFWKLHTVENNQPVIISSPMHTTAPGNIFINKILWLFYCYNTLCRMEVTFWLKVGSNFLTFSVLN